MYGWPDCALDEEMLTIRPQPASTMSGSTAWTQWNTPLRLTSMTCRQSSNVRSVNRLNRSMPAAFTRMVTAPSWSRMAAIAESTATRSVTSAVCANLSSDARRSMVATWYPSERSRLTTAWPMPEPPPVTTAVFMSSRSSQLSRINLSDYENRTLA